MPAPNLGASWQWGQSTTLLIDPIAPVNAAQILNVNLPVPAVCVVYLTARILPPGTAGLMWSFAANFKVGVGRTSLQQTFIWNNQPTIAVPLQFTLPATPITALQLDVTASGSGPLELDIGAELAPVTWIPSSDSSLQFGMALPGEAEGLDDDAYDEIQEDYPEMAERLRAEQEEGAPFPSLEYVEEHAERFGRQRRRQYPQQANEHARRLRQQLRNWNGRNGR